MGGCLGRLITILFVIVIFSCFGLAAGRGPEKVDTSDFDSVRSSVEPYLDEWFEQARAHRYVYDIDDEVVQGLSSEDAYMERIWVSSGVLFIVTGAVRGYQQGYIYSPSGGLPEWDGLRTREIEEFWFVFTDNSN
jgi:hypothetical protein